MSDEPAAPPYRWEVFRHWANLALIGIGCAAGTFHDPMWFLFTGAAAAGVLWVVPEMPPVRGVIDKKYRARQLMAERAYYLKELWGLEEEIPKGNWLSRLFVEAEVTDPDTRIRDRSSLACRDYLEMREIVRKLGEMRQVPGTKLSVTDLDRLELIINGYLRMLIAIRPLSDALSRVDVPRLEREVRDLDRQLTNADPTVKPALIERQRIATSQLERQPKLEATLQLLRSRAQDMAYQVRNIHAAVLADPGQDVHAMLDEMATQQEMMGDPLTNLSADQFVRQFLEGQSRKRDDEPDPGAAARASRRERA